MVKKLTIVAEIEYNEQVGVVVYALMKPAYAIVTGVADHCVDLDLSLCLRCEP
jgi:hypothetical protein